MSKKSGRKENSFTKLLKSPIRALIRAKNAYVRGMTSCTGGISSGGVSQALPRSFSQSSSAVSDGGDDDYRELVRAASVRRMAMERNRQEPSPLDLRRNQSVGMGRIDEEKPYEFGPDDMLVFQRSRTVGYKGVAPYNPRYV